MKKNTKKYSSAMKKLWRNPEYRKRQCKLMLGKTFSVSEEGKKNHSKARRRLWKTDSYRNKQKNNTGRFQLGSKLTESHKNNIRKASKIVATRVWNSYSTEQKKRRIMKTIKSSQTLPNISEKKLNTLIKTVSPDYTYVGNGKLLIGYKNPDFIDKKHNKIIELFGDYWHSKERLGVSKLRHEKERINYFKKFGYDTLIVWYSEMKDISSLSTKLNSFIYEI